MKITWSQLALDRAAEEAEYIAADKPAAAQRWLDDLFDTVERLESFSESGQAVAELERPNYRQVIFKSHRIVYKLVNGQVYILTVRRTRQQLAASENEP